MTFTRYPAQGGGGGGAVDSVNGQTGVVVLTTTNIPEGTRLYFTNARARSALSASAPLSYNSGTGAFSIPTASSGVTGALSGTDWDIFNGKQAGITGGNNLMVYKDDNGDVISFDGWGFDPTIDGARWSLTADVTDTGGNQLHVWNAQFNPSENAENASWQFRNTYLTVDEFSSGFNFGTNAGTSLNAENLTIHHHGTATTSGLALYTGTFEIGNGTDPLSVGGLSYSYGFGSISDNVTITGPIQGYGIQPNLAAGVTVATSNTYYAAFYDAANVSCDWPASWISLNASPNISKITNNSSFQALSCNAVIPDVDDNCGVNVIGIGGNYGAFGTNAYWNGVNVNPIITAGQNVTLCGLYANSVTAAGFVKALDVIGDVSITGDLQLTGALNYNGPLNLFSPYTLISNPSPGVVGSLFSFVSGPTCAANSTLTNADFLGVNTASLIDIGDNSTVTTFLTGISALGLPAVAKIGAGATVDRIAGATFALSLDATAGAGGVIDNVMLGQALAVPNGITTVSRIYGWYADLPFGAVGTDQYGVYTTAAFGLNYLGGKLKIGGGDSVTTPDCTLEVATGGVVFANMDTITRDALAATPGMTIFNTDTLVLETYNGSAWV